MESLRTAGQVYLSHVLSDWDEHHIQEVKDSPFTPQDRGQLPLFLLSSQLVPTQSACVPLPALHSGLYVTCLAQPQEVLSKQEQLYLLI